MDGETEQRAVDNNLAEAVVSNCDIFIVASFSCVWSYSASLAPELVC